MKRIKSFEEEGPCVYVVATPIGNLNELSPRAIEILNTVDVIAAEDTRNTMKLLTHFGISTRLISHHQHNEIQSAKGIIEMLKNGMKIAIVSDAGYPLISDPGNVLSKMVIEEDFPLIPVSGSNAMLNALVCSGMNTQHFLFYGFLKSSENERIKELNQLKQFPYTLIFYESPHRIHKMLDSALTVLGNRKICLARELTKKHEEFIHGTIVEILEIVDDLKGEIVVIVEGNVEQNKPIDIVVDVKVLIQQYINEGLTTNAAIKKVAKEYGLSKNELYKEYHMIN